VGNPSVRRMTMRFVLGRRLASVSRVVRTKSRASAVSVVPPVTLRASTREENSEESDASGSVSSE
jgi:hypothetical protein